jgi:predicted SAM-dependent methyltransferase
MIYLNLGCGYPRPLEEPWINIDQLNDKLFPNTPERRNLCKEKNYLDCDLSLGIPFYDNEVDAILASHMVEHLDPREGLAFFRECRRVLKEEGVLRVSVPDTELIIDFELKGIPYSDEYRPKGMSFGEHVLTFPEHKQFACYGTVFALYYMAGFKEINRRTFGNSPVPLLASLDNRASFSLFMEGTK